MLIACSGNLVHNLYLRKPKEAAPYDWALEFDATAKRLIHQGALQSLLEYDRLGESARLSIPTNEHYLPALCALALREESEPVTFSMKALSRARLQCADFRLGDRELFQTLSAYL